MKNNDFEKIVLELKNAGASEKEAEELSSLSQNISNLLSIERSPIVKNMFLYPLIGREQAQQSFTKKWLVIPLFTALFLMFLGSYTIVNAQKSLPGESLYPVKILSENIVVTVAPSFKGEILQRRSEEIKVLSQQNNSQNLGNLRKTINNYKKILKEDGKIDAKSFEESKNNLEEASKSATLENKKSIENILIQTKNRERDIQRGSSERESGRSFIQNQIRTQGEIKNRINTENSFER